MKIKTCDIGNRKHSGKVDSYKLDVIFDHDQEDGKSKCEPYFDTNIIELCESCRKTMMTKRKHVYGYGAMGHNTYTL